MKNNFSFFLRCLLVWPFFLFFFFSLKKKYKENLNKSIFWKEEERYKWFKKYSSFLLWLYGKKFKFEGSDSWDYNPTIFYMESQNNFLPLFFIKKNDFQKHLPVFFVLEKSFPKNTLLGNFLSLINPIFLIEDDKKNNEKEISQRVKIPRTAFFIFHSLNFKKEKFLMKIAKNNLLKTIKLGISNNSISVEKKFYSKDLLNMML